MESLSSLIISIFPYAIGAAISPLILATLLSTITPENRPRLSASSYYFGSIILFLIIAFFGLYIGTSLPKPLLGSAIIGGIIEIVLGGILVIIAFKTLFIGEEPHEGGLPGIINALREDNSLSVFIKFFYYGFITYLASFATSIIILVAGIIIGLSNPGFVISGITIIVLGLIALIIAEILFIAYLLFPTQAGDILAPARNWINNYGYYLIIILYLILGVFFIIRGFMAI